MNLEPRGASTDVAAWAGIRTILVPPDIVAVNGGRRRPSRRRRRGDRGRTATQQPSAPERVSGSAIASSSKRKTVITVRATERRLPCTSAARSC